MIGIPLRVFVLAATLGGALSAPSAWAAAAPVPSDAAAAQANSGTVGIMSGEVDGTDARIAADLASVLDDGDRLRVLPMIGKGSVQNLADIMYLDGADAGIVQSDVWTYAKDQQLFPGLEQKVEYVAKLYDEEVHVLARGDIARIEDLAGRDVNVDVRGSGTAITAAIVLRRLGVAVQPAYDDQDVALERLKRGEIASLVYVSGKPTRLFAGLDPGTGLHFLPILPTAALPGTYSPSQLSHADYPSLIPDGADVPTISVSAVLAIHAWPPGTDRYRKVVRLVDAFFTKFPLLLVPPRHPKWREVDLTAPVAGWKRFAPAEQWLVAHQFPAATEAAGLRKHLVTVEASPSTIASGISSDQGPDAADMAGRLRR